MRKYLLMLLFMPMISFGQDVLKITPQNVTVTVPLIAPNATEVGQVVNLGLLNGTLANYLLKKDAVSASVLSNYMLKSDTVSIRSIIATSANYVPLMNSTGVLTNSVISQSGTNLNMPSVFFVSTLQAAPATATSTGKMGEVRFTPKGIYICIATNSWIKCAGSDW